MLKDMVDRIVGAGANVVFVQKGIDDLAQHFLANRKEKREEEKDEE
jgi:chaperonin GroEL (HSP60 family)